MKCGVGLVWFDARDREAGASLDLLAPKFWIFWIFWRPPIFRIFGEVEVERDLRSFHSADSHVS